MSCQPLGSGWISSEIATDLQATEISSPEEKI